MKPFVPGEEHSSSKYLYIQLYEHIKSEIILHNIGAGDKLPSLREIANTSGISITTAGQAYDQLLTEGYIISKPQSGYYVAEIPSLPNPSTGEPMHSLDLMDRAFDRSKYLCDLTAFDFQKWKKCMSRVFNEYPQLLLFESDIQGEASLRFEICKYLYSSRGVSAKPDQVVIGAGTQQLTSHLCRILSRMNIDLVCTEDPGYLPIQKIFSDNGFGISKIPVSDDGIEIERLPVNVRSAVYVCPANQFPTGSVMPIANRYRLLAWAKANGSIILEDDYDSELRYFGKPIPALQGLDDSGSVVYFGSFSSTLFPAAKISYMILPPEMASVFATIKNDYSQTCSKAEQLALALFMEDGYYYAAIRNLRKLYSQKLQQVVSAFAKYAGGAVSPANTKSGINMILEMESDLAASELAARAETLALNMVPLDALQGRNRKKKHLIFYYNQIPLEAIDERIRSLASAWELA